MHRSCSPILLGLALALGAAPTLGHAQDTTTATGPAPRPVLGVSAPSAAAERITICVVPGSGTVYRVGVSGAPAACLQESHTALTLNLQGVQGERGESGPAGPEGAQGPQGEPGIKGDSGVTGPAGPQGEVGPVGAQGAVGPQGAPGARGADGTNGVNGADGAVGPQGPQGDIGPAGPAGPQGTIGPIGATGAPGAMGPVGPEGPAGAAGPQGVPGDVGPAGPAGAPGEAGPQGAPGIAGPAGPEGPAGATGATGATGAQGDPGTTDHSALTNLTADDHAQYLRTDGTRALSGNLSANGKLITGLAAGTAAGHAVRFEQAVKGGDTAGGDLSGTYPAPTVAQLQGRPVSARAPSTNQVLTWNDTAWAPAAPTGGSSAHGDLTGLASDDHPQYLRSGVRAAVDGFAVTGTSGSGNIPVSGAGTRLMWYPAKAAFRAGSVGSFGSTYWDPGSVGVGSAAFGENTRASGAQSFAAGMATTASGEASVALGNNSTASADRALAFNGTASAVGAIALGSGAQATGDDALALGPSSIAGGLASIVIGPSIANGNFGVAIGLQNSASGQFSVAIGKNARTNHRQGSIVLGDGCAGFSSDSVYPTANNQFVARGCGGIRFFTSQNLSSGVEVAPGGGSWSSISDRNRKENFHALDGEDLLRRMRGIPVTSWNYIAQGRTIRHIGPMAQDWERTFGLSGDSTTINTGDIDGVNFAGVQALEARSTRHAAQVAALAAQLAGLEARVADRDALEHRVRQLEQQLAQLAQLAAALAANAPPTTPPAP